MDATTHLSIDEKGIDTKIWSGREDYDKSHIPGAVFADILQDFSDPEGPYNFAVIAHGGVDFEAADWDSRLAWQLKFEGFDNVAILEGGYDKWIRENRPVTHEAAAPEKGSLNITRRPEFFAGKEDVLKAIDDDNVVI